MKNTTIHLKRGHKHWMSKERPYVDKGWLHQKYNVEGLSLQAIARLCGITHGTTIHRWTRRFNFPPHKAIAPREKNYKWNGGQYISPSGYKYVICDRGHPRGVKKGKYSDYIPEQYAVMEKHLGRYLKQDEVIHHLNGIKLDNRLENLMLCKNKREHHLFEGRVSTFTKQLIWGELNPEVREKIKKLFEDFIKEK